MVITNNEIGIWGFQQNSAKSKSATITAAPVQESKSELTMQSKEAKPAARAQRKTRTVTTKQVIAAKPAAAKAKPAATAKKIEAASTGSGDIWGYEKSSAAKEQPAKAKRGRPARVAKPAAEQTPVVVAPKRGRGRPAKIAQPAIKIAAKGRPRKVQSTEAVEEVKSLADRLDISRYLSLQRLYLEAKQRAKKAKKAFRKFKKTGTDIEKLLVLKLKAKLARKERKTIQSELKEFEKNIR